MTKNKIKNKIKDDILKLQMHEVIKNNKMYEMFIILISIKIN